MRFIGDIHGDITGAYSAATRNCDESVQVGDFGMGFISPYIREVVDVFHTGNPTHRFIRGNHDDPAVCRLSPGWIEDGTYDADREIMYIGGARSIDTAIRTSGKNWWPDEELSLIELERIRAAFVYFKPKVVVTHDCPRPVAESLFFAPPNDERPHIRTRTAEALDVMLRDHPPDLWVFGHWHESRQFKRNGTEFICLGIGEYKDISL